MDTFVDSSWYFLRFTDAQNDRAPFSSDKANHWMPLDQYIGGIEHAVLHLLYARFFTKVLHDLGMVVVEEPFFRLFTQGMITLGGAKMSKSKGNTVDPLPIFESHGADALRLYHLFMGPPTDDAEWSERGVDGTFRFLERVWRLGRDEVGTVSDRPEVSADAEILRVAHRTVKKVTKDIDRFAFNTAVAALMSYVNELYAYLQSPDGGEADTFDRAYDLLLMMLSPMAPHLSHELWEQRGHAGALYERPWPTWDEDMVKLETVTMVIQVNGKVRDRMEVDAGISAEDAEAAALASEKVASWTEGKTVHKVISRPPKLVNIVVG
jgi:leucyl-tRNA synthetase